MKRLWFWTLLCLLLLPISARMESGAEGALFPAKGENGQWGYIDVSGAWVIPPQYDTAGDFRGNYAVIGVFPEGFVPTEDTTEYPDCWGVIDRQGNMVLPPEYAFDAGYDGFFYGGYDTGIWYVTRWRDLIWDENEEEALQENLVGFFDIPSGCFSGLKWHNIGHWCSDSRLIAVMDREKGAGYADRTTGELVIPYQYFDSDCGNFYEGIAAAAHFNEDGNPGDFFLIDETGREIPLPAGIHAVMYHGSSEGRVLIRNEEKLYGYADRQGRVVIAPQFIMANDFEDGIATVKFKTEDWGVIDREGNVIARGITTDRSWTGPEIKNGLRVEKMGGHAFSIVDLQGNTVLHMENERLWGLTLPMKNGLCWFDETMEGSQSAIWGLVNLQGEIVSEAQWKYARDYSGIEIFSEGLQRVYRETANERRYGFIDETGTLAIPLQYVQAENFRNGLAYVEEDGRCGYIDHAGNEVFFWATDNDE